MTKQSSLDTLKSTIDLARKIYIIYLSLIMYGIFALFIITDKAIVLNESFILPLINIEVPVIAFLILYPFIIASIYIYLHFYLFEAYNLVLKDIYKTECLSINQIREISSWIVIKSILPGDRERGFSKIQNSFIKFIIFGLFPVYLIFFFNRIDDILVVRFNDTLFGSILLYIFFILLLVLISYTELLYNEGRIDIKKFSVLIIDFKEGIFNTYSFRIFYIMFFFSFILTGLSFYTGIYFPGALYMRNPNIDLSYESLVNEPEYDYDGIYWSNLSNLNLRNCKFTSTVFKRVNLKNTIFDESEIQKSNFFKSDARGASFYDTNLYGSVFREAILDSTNFSESNIDKTNFEGAIINNAVFRDVNSVETNFKNAILNIVDFSKSEFKESFFDNSKAISANFDTTILSNVNFSGTILDSASFCYAKILDGTNFENASLNVVTFDSADLKGVRFQHADLTGSHFNNSFLVNCNFTDAILKNVSFENAIIEDCDFLQAKELRIEYFSSARKLDNSKFIPSFRQDLEYKYPHLFN